MRTADLSAGPDAARWIDPQAGPVHGTCIAFAGRGALFIGASGRGKSAAALEALSRGAGLVADDRVEIEERAGAPCVARCPAPLRGLIEARGIGLLKVAFVPEISVDLVIDLDRPEPDRLPPHRVITIGTTKVDLILAKDHPNIVSGVLVRLSGARHA